MIGPFRGEYRWLSNFYATPVELDGQVFPTAEHAYQWHKALAAGVTGPLELIFRADTPGQAKRLGRSFPYPPVWDERTGKPPLSTKVRVMRRVIEAKFPAGSLLASSLMDTHPEPLIEVNDWGDRYWGMVYSGVADDGHDPAAPVLVGENQLGKVLVWRRAALRALYMRPGGSVSTQAAPATERG